MGTFWFVVTVTHVERNGSVGLGLVLSMWWSIGELPSTGEPENIIWMSLQRSPGTPVGDCPAWWGYLLKRDQQPFLEIENKSQYQVIWLLVPAALAEWPWTCLLIVSAPWGDRPGENLLVPWISPIAGQIFIGTWGEVVIFQIYFRTEPFCPANLMWDGTEVYEAD